MKEFTKNLIVYSILLLSAFLLAIGTWYADPLILIGGLCCGILSTFVAWALDLI
jgi:hypothetical protein